MSIDHSVPLELFVHLLPSRARILGIDLGTRTIGIAISDDLRCIASPLTTINCKKFQSDSESLLKLCFDHKIAGLVMGLPINMNGSEGPRAQSTRSFVRNLSQKTNLPITYWDERLSTAAVTRTLLETNASRNRRSKLVDKIAATYILQGALDRMSYLCKDCSACP